MREGFYHPPRGRWLTSRATAAAGEATAETKERSSAKPSEGGSCDHYRHTSKARVLLSQPSFSSSRSRFRYTGTRMRACVVRDEVRASRRRGRVSSERPLAHAPTDATAAEMRCTVVSRDLSASPPPLAI